ncbi:hypothetical protein BV22DRAFT_1005946 [Leucogyrophana mollusca]|uniref:Uncharacterized protein n=1 Tax=Leucogyrophana mollusca TaxID=85980 RepID=A0ACB8BQP4_9AGAM|nr:hypothetical protein BV22DRAFT_1005946 [Leucogyrophana mollusca]
MAIPADLQATALLAHISSQLSLNVAFLESQSYLSPEDAASMRAIISRLPVSASVATSSHLRVTSTTTASSSTTTLGTGVARTASASGRSVPPPPAPAPVTAPAVYARAIWAYNEDGADPADLTFSAGELIEIVTEKNADWWLGRARGMEALFPSNYVEKVDPASVPAITASLSNTQVSGAPTTRAYRPFGAALHGTDAPPPGGAGVNSVGLQEASGQAEKKSKFGKYGNTMAHSAAGGVGFGAGSAIGGGLVRAIF